MKAVAAVSAFLLAGCAMPGQMPDSDFVWQEVTLPIGYQQVHRNLRDATDSCPSYSLDGGAYDDIRELRLTAYHKVLIGASPTVGAKIIARDTGGSTVVRIGTTGFNDGAGMFGMGERGWSRKRLLRWASGDLRCRD